MELGIGERTLIHRFVRNCRNGDVPGSQIEKCESVWPINDEEKNLFSSRSGRPFDDVKFIASLADFP